MSVLLTHAYFLEDDAKEQQIMRPYPPLGLLYIAAYLDKHSINNTVFDTTFSSKKLFREHVLSTQPAIVGLYVNLMTKLNVLETILFIRANLPNTKIILGGPEVTYSAENFLRYGADYIVIGEGEETTLALIESIHQNASSEKFHSIPGVAFLNEDQFVQTPSREKIKDLDELCIPAREKINLNLYLEAWKKHHGKNAISVSTMRGCPYTCKWCSRAVYGLSYRRR